MPITVLATLPSLVNGKIPADQLPSYVDDVVEYPDFTSFPGTGESGKIYVAVDTTQGYRWSGSTYTQVMGQGTHTHDPSEIVSLNAALTNLSNAVAGKASVSHGHAISHVSGLDSALAGKASTAHFHDAADVTSGKLNPARMIPDIAVVDYQTPNLSPGGEGGMVDVTLYSNLSVANPENPINGATWRFRFKQDAVGNRIVTLGSKFKIPSSASNPLPWSTAPHAVDIMAATYHAGTDRWHVVAFIPGY